MGRPKTVDERNLIAKEALAIFRAKRAKKNCDGMRAATPHLFNRCLRQILEETEAALAERYADFPELEEIMHGILADKKDYEIIHYFFGVKQQIYSDLLEKYKELSSLSPCWQMYGEGSPIENNLCVRRNVEYLEEYGREKYPENERDIRNFIENYLFGKPEPGVLHTLDNIKYKFGVRTPEPKPEPNEIRGGRRSRKMRRRVRRSMRSRRSRRFTKH